MTFIDIAINYILPYLGDITAAILFLAPLSDILSIRHTGNNGNLNSIPHILLFSQCLAWVYYGGYIQNPSVCIINIFGTFICLFYIVSASANIKENNKRLYLDIMLIIGFAIPTMCYLIIMLWIKETEQENSFGYVALILNMIFFITPLATLYEVIKNKDASSMSIPLTGAIVLNSTVWLLYAIGISDQFLMIPQIAGLFFGTIQVLVIIYYKLCSNNSSVINAEYTPMNASHV